MDFTGKLNFPNPATLNRATEEEKQKIMQARFRQPTLIRDARATQQVTDKPVDSTELLANGIGFMLVRAPSRVTNWADAHEVREFYYDEILALGKTLLPGAHFSGLDSHTYRNEEIKDHYWQDGIQYGPCAQAVHNDYADFVSDDGLTTIKKFSEVQSMPSDKRVVGINIWRSVSPEPLARLPLAVCDRTSIDPRDLEYDLNENAKPVPFNAHYCKPNDGQRWSYFSDMTCDEALVFTTYDSHPPHGEVFRPTLHSAVPIPDTEGLQPRVSVEVRLFGIMPLDESSDR